MERYICIHGHFYQPPRENPWLECIDPQDSAHPYHDWNERVTAECYAPNTASRILDQEGRIQQIVNNYTRISFNFGPTLLSWLESHAPETYRAILQADRETQRAFSGHGSALAQGYNHMVMPLASRRDKYTQVRWAIRDFEHRFGRRPEGMWLPETAVDMETLDIMGEHGLRFTILSPRQARRVRALESQEWLDVSRGKIDTTMPYSLRLPSGRSIALFFYNEAVSRSVAFEGLLTSGEPFAHRLLDSFHEDRTGPQLVHIATDGETYGHHHRFGDMALAYALRHIETDSSARLTNYGEYLEKHPPTHEAEVLENTSWSCAHGLERWRSDCGCSSGGRPGWNQAWRAPLREALDWVRDTLAPKYEDMAGRLLKDPWAARDDYIGVVLDRSAPSLEGFLARHAAGPLDSSQRVACLKLLEMQRHAMLMFTSCGWFFSDLSGIETVQVIQYAARAVQLAEEVSGEALEPRFLQLLEPARSNIPGHGTGRQVYEKLVRPAMLDLTSVAAHYAVSSLFEDYSPQAQICSYIVDRQDYHTALSGRAKLAVGRATVTSQLTQETAALTFGALHLGDHNVSAGVRGYQGESVYRAMAQEVTQAFSRADLPAVIRLLDRHFGTSDYSLKSLFRDEQRRVLNHILESTLSEVETEYRQIYERFYSLMRFLTDLGNPLPQPLRSAAEFILHSDLRRALSTETLDLRRIWGLLEKARLWNIELDTRGLGYLLERAVERLMARFISTPEDLPLLKEVEGAVELALSVPLQVNLWKVQNPYYDMLINVYPGFRERAQQGDETAREWVGHFLPLGIKLSVRTA